MKKTNLFQTLINFDSHIVSSISKNTVFSSLLLGSHKNTVLIDLVKVLPLFKRALLLVREICANKGNIVIILNNKTPVYLEEEAYNYFSIMKNNWPEGSLTNLAVLKKTCNKFTKSSNKGLKGLDRKLSNQSNKFFKKYKTVGFSTTIPRLIISFVPLNNPLFLNELRLLNIPLVSLSGQNLSSFSAISSDFPIVFNNKNHLFNNLLLKMFILEAKKGREVLFNKQKTQRLSLKAKHTFLNKIKGVNLIR